MVKGAMVPDLLSGSIVAFLALLGLFGWVADLGFLASLGVNRAPMAPSTALLLLLFSAALYSRGLGAKLSRSGGPARILVLLGSLLALLLFGAYLFGLPTRFESLGLSLSAKIDGVSDPGTMSPVSALCFVLFGLSFSLGGGRDQGKEGLRSLSLGLILSELLLCFIFLLGYLLGETLLQGNPFATPALSTILALFVLGLGQAWALENPSLGSRAEEGETRSHFLFLLPLVALSVLGIVITGFFSYRAYERRYRGEVEARLEAIAELKLSELGRFRKERLDDGWAFVDNLSFTRLARRLLAAGTGRETRAPLEDWLWPYVGSDRYSGIYILDAAGRTRFALPEEADPRASISTTQAAELFERAEPSFQDFYRDDRADRVQLSVLVPLRDREGVGGPLGILVLRIDPSVYLYPFINSWPAPSRSGETLLVRREGNSALFLNDLRFQARAALNLRLPLDRLGAPEVMAALGREGVFEGQDYRGRAVIASLRSLAGSPWAIVAKMDSSEAFAALGERMWVVILVVTGLVAATSASGIIYFRARNRRLYSERLETLLALKKTSSFLENLLAYANTPIIVWDAEYRVTHFNHAFEVLSGRKAGEIVGGPLDPLFPQGEVEASLGMIRETSTGRRWETVEMDILSKGGGIRRLLWNSAPIFSPDGETLVATIAQGSDVTETRDAERRLIEQVEELRRWQDLMLGREDRIRELKFEINLLLEEAGRARRYAEGGQDGA